MLHVELLTYTPDADKIVAAAAKLCYSKSEIQTLLENLTPEKVEKFLNMLSELGHQSPVEHACFTFGIEGVSRSLLAQITRHRIASFSVQSQRYNDAEGGFEYVIPPEIEAIPEAKAEYVRAMEEDAKHYDSLRNLLIEHHARELMDSGMEKEAAYKAAGKMSNEDARFVLPNACTTKMIMTMNVRSLFNFFKLRCCNRAQWEIRELAYQMLLLCREAAPNLFRYAGPGCLYGKCPEGAMCCGKTAEVRKKYGVEKE